MYSISQSHGQIVFSGNSIVISLFNPSVFFCFAIMINCLLFYFIRSDIVEVPKKPADFLYLGEYEPWGFDAFRPKQPNAKRGDQCLVSYLSIEPNASIYDFDCEANGWQWASCTACFLPNTFLDYTNIVARGLCSRTLFDTIFEVNYD